MTYMLITYLCLSLLHTNYADCSVSKADNDVNLHSSRDGVEADETSLLHTRLLVRQRERSGNRHHMSSSKKLRRKQQQAREQVPIDINDLVRRWPANHRNKLRRMYKKTTWKVLEKSIQLWKGDEIHLPEDGWFVRAGDLPQMWVRDATCSFHHILASANEIVRKPFLEGGDNATFFPLFTNLLVEMMILNPRCPTWSFGSWTCPEFDPPFGYEADSPLYVLRYLRYLRKHDALWGMLSNRTKRERIPAAVKAIVDNFWEDSEKSFHQMGVRLIQTESRPSDHATVYPFNIPNNLFAVAEFNHLTSSENKIDFVIEETLQRAENLAKAIGKDVYEFAVDQGHQDGVESYCYEANFNQRQDQTAPVERNSCLKLDDANLPSLLSIPYLADGAPYNRTLYENTRKFVLSGRNPFFFKGKLAEGIGSNHFTLDRVWPMSVIAQALTSTEKTEVESLLKTLMNTDAGTDLMHESFHPDNASNFTRKWFDWPNALFSELVAKCCGDVILEDGIHLEQTGP